MLCFIYCLFLDLFCYLFFFLFSVFSFLFPFFLADCAPGEWGWYVKMYLIYILEEKEKLTPPGCIPLSVCLTVPVLGSFLCDSSPHIQVIFQ